MTLIAGKMHVQVQLPKELYKEYKAKNIFEFEHRPIDYFYDVWPDALTIYPTDKDFSETSYEQIHDRFGELKANWQPLGPIVNIPITEDFSFVLLEFRPTKRWRIKSALILLPDGTIGVTELHPGQWKPVGEQ